MIAAGKGEPAELSIKPDPAQFIEYERRAANAFNQASAFGNSILSAGQRSTLGVRPGGVTPKIKSWSLAVPPMCLLM